MKYKYVTVLLLVGLMACANEETKNIKGKIISFDYAEVDNIPDSSWVKIDNRKFLHMASIKDARDVKYSLPASSIYMDTLRSPISMHGRSMGNYLARYLNHINKTKTDSTSPDYKVIDPYLIDIKGILKIMKTDSSLINVTVPKDYPVEITTLR